MNPVSGAVLLALTLVSCRPYHYYNKVTDQSGMIPADQYARYGREQAQKVAIGRAFADAHQGSSREDYARQVQAGERYAHTLPDVVNVTGDPLGHWLLVQFKSGWRVAVTPIADGKRPSETPNLPAAAKR